MSFDLDGFTDACVRAEGAPEVVELTRAALARRSELLAAIGPIEEHTMRTLHASPDRTVQILGWAPGMRAPAHEHRMWSVIGVAAGCEQNGYWERRGEGIERSGGVAIEAGMVLAMDEQVIHDVANAREEFTIAIHVYGGDIRGAARSAWNPMTMREEPFDTPFVERLMGRFNELQRREPQPFASANVPRIMASLLAEERR